MNKHFLKTIRDGMPEPFQHFFSPLIRYKLIKNREFRNYFDLLQNRDLSDTNKINNYQFKQLKDILIHSFENVPYYNDLFKSISFDPYRVSEFGQMKSIPYLTREIITNNYEKLISRKKIKNGYYIGGTGGSSGVPLKFLLDYDSVYKENAFIYFFRQKLGYGFNDKVITFRQVEYGDRLWKNNPMHNELIFLPLKLSKNLISDYAKKINEYKPLYINGYLSAIWYFAKLLEEYGIKLNFSLKGIYLISENINDDQRKYIEHFFNVKSTTFYGHSERVIIADEIVPNGYLFDPYYGYTECIPQEDGICSIVGTGFLNKSMPFIRYKTDDVCSQNGQYYSIDGKRYSTEGLIGKNGEFITSTSFDLEDPIFGNITNYQFVQNEPGKADILLLPGKNFREPELEIIANSIHKKTKGAIDLNVILVDKLILTPRGKYQMYISTLNKVKRGNNNSVLRESNE